MRVIFLLAVVSTAIAQVTAPPTVSPEATTGPTYSSTTGFRYNYYAKTITETTNFGIRLTKTSSPDTATPAGLWTVVSIDTTPRSTSSGAAVRAGARYFLTSTASHNVIVYANLQAGATTSTTSAISAASSSSSTTGNSVTNLLGNLQGGMGVVWRACHTFNKNTSVNCVVDIDYEINSVSTQTVQTPVGFFVGLVF